MALHTLYTLEAPVFDTYRAQSHPYVKWVTLMLTLFQNTKIIVASVKCAWLP